MSRHKRPKYRLSTAARCSRWSVAALGFPRLASDEVSLQLTVPQPGFPPSHAAFIALRLNDGAVLALSSQGATDKTTEACARKAYTRAESKLGG
jgi:hypothetical protein